MYILEEYTWQNRPSTDPIPFGPVEDLILDNRAKHQQTGIFPMCRNSEPPTVLARRSTAASRQIKVLRELMKDIDDG